MILCYLRSFSLSFDPRYSLNVAPMSIYVLFFLLTQRLCFSTNTSSCFFVKQIVILFYPRVVLYVQVLAICAVAPELISAEQIEKLVQNSVTECVHKAAKQPVQNGQVLYSAYLNCTHI